MESLQVDYNREGAKNAKKIFDHEGHEDHEEGIIPEFEVRSERNVNKQQADYNREGAKSAKKTFNHEGHEDHEEGSIAL